LQCGMHRQPLFLALGYLGAETSGLESVDASELRCERKCGWDFMQD